MDASGIQNVTAAMRLRLLDAIGQQPAAETVYVGPLHDDGAEGALLVLFLYRVVPNADLRNTPHAVVGGGLPEGRIVYDNAVPLDLHYVLTAGGRRDGGELESLQRLGQAIRALNDEPVLAGSLLQNESVRITQYPGSSDELSRVWALFPDQNYRTSVLYLVSPVWIDPASPPLPAPPVVATPFQAGPMPSQGNA